MREKPWRDKEIVTELYVDKEKPLSEIAEIFDCSKRTVSDWVNRHGLDRQQETASRYDELTEELLYEMYVEKDMSQYEIADEVGCTQVTVSNKMDEFSIGIKRDSYPKLRDKEWLYEQYVEKQKSSRDIAGELGCAFGTVLRWLYNHNIETRPPSSEKPAYYQTTTQGYETVCSRCSGDLRVVSVHQLLAIADGEPPEKVFSDGDFHVHHKNGVPWDNREQNIEVLSGSEHARLHALEQ